MSRPLLVILAAAAIGAAGPPTAAGQDRVPAGAPNVRAPAALLLQPDTGDVVFSRAADDERAIASTTKLMTALLTLERASLTDVFTATAYSPLPAESVIGLQRGERLTVADLLRGLLLASANDAAVTLAARVSGTRAAFVRLMNERARALALDETSFANPVGLDDPDNHSSARDLLTLAQVLLRNDFFAETVNRPSAVLRSGARVRTIANRNMLVRTVPFVSGVKTGRTQQAGYVLIASAKRAGVPLLSVVMGEPSEAARNADTLALLRYGLSRYRATIGLRRGQVLGRVGLDYRDEEVEVVASREVRAVVKRGERLAVRVSPLPGELEGPLPKGHRVATATVTRRGKVLARVPVVTRAAVPESSVGDRVDAFFSSTFALVLVILLLGCSLFLALLRRRATRRRRERARQTKNPRVQP